MREFNTSGPCNPALHYTVMREALIVSVITKVKKGRYFTLFAPRQAGKTTFFKLLLNGLSKDFTTVWISFENLKTASKTEFYQALNHKLHRGLEKHKIQSEILIKNTISLEYFFEKTSKKFKPLVLVIDEFEEIPDCVLNEILPTFRNIYHKKEYYSLHSLCFSGISTGEELFMTKTSPFNIAEDLQLPYFTEAEVRSLIEQYVVESGQRFEEQVIKRLYENTQGQPGLVCALCSYLVEELATNHHLPVVIEHYLQVQQHFLTELFDKNIINIVQKAPEKRAFMLKLLFSEDRLPFSIHDPDMAWLYANGVIDKKDGYVDILVPLYAKRLITAFRPLINGETQYYINSPSETLNQYLTPEGELNINELLKEYLAYVRRRGFRAFDTENLKESAWHYSLDGFINFFIQCLGGQTFVEVPTGRGRTDILILYQNQKYVIETKRFVNNYYFKQGKGQLAEYLKSEEIEEGYYVVFSNIHTEKDPHYLEEVLKGKRIHTHIILTKFEQPSRLPVPDELKLSESEKVALNLLNMGKLTIAQIAEATGIKTARIEQFQNKFWTPK